MKTILFKAIIFIMVFPMGVLAQTKTGVITGVVKTSDGNFAAGAAVSLKEVNAATLTNEDGVFRLKSLKMGNYILVVKYMGKSQEKPVFVKENKTTSENIIFALSLAELNQVTVTGYQSNNSKTVTVGKSGISAKDLPQSIQIINSQVIEDQQINRLSDAVKNVNGIALTDTRGGVMEGYYARGYSLGANNILKNGSRTNTGSLAEASTLESVEVLKGSAALLYGGVTGGAVINMVTKKPQFNYGGEVSFRTGSYDFYKPTADFYGPITKNLAFRVIGTLEDDGSFRNNVSTKRTYINPSLLYNLSKKTEILVQGDYLKSDYTPDFGIGSVEGKINTNVGRSTFLNTPWAYNKTDQFTAQMSVNHQFNEIWKLNISGNLQSYDRNYFGAERIQADINGDVARNLNRTKSDEYTFNQQINLTGALNTGKINHKVLVGADADQSDIDNYKYSIDGGALYDNINVYDVENTATRTDVPTTSYASRTNALVYRMGVFAQDLITLSDKMKFLAGIRWTFQKTPQSEVYDYATNTTTITENKTADGTVLGPKIEKAFSPKFGFIYQPFKTTSVYVSYANNFTSNSGYDRNYAPLDPSIIDQYELGVKNDFFNGRVSGNVTWYRIQNNKFAQSVIAEDGVSIPDANMKEFNGKTASDGIEVDLTGNITKGLNIIAGYAYNYMRYTDTNPVNGNILGERLVGTAKHTANGTAFYTFQSGKIKGLKLGASAFYTGDRNGGWNNKIGQSQVGSRLIPVDGFTTFDFSAGYKFRKISLLAKVSNITNEFNYTVHENYSVNPIAPRSFITTLAYKF